MDAETIYGGCKGPDAMYLKLISGDGHEFIIKREHSLFSQTIRAMLEGPVQISENVTNEINLKNIKSSSLEIVCMYLTFRAKYPDCSLEEPFHVPPERAKELLCASLFLKC